MANAAQDSNSACSCQSAPLPMPKVCFSLCGNLHGWVQQVVTHQMQGTWPYSCGAELPEPVPTLWGIDAPTKTMQSRFRVVLTPSQAWLRRDWRLGGESNQEPVAFVRACAPSGCLVEVDHKRPSPLFPFPFCPAQLSLFPAPTLHTSYPTSVGLSAKPGGPRNLKQGIRNDNIFEPWPLADYVQRFQLIFRS